MTLPLAGVDAAEGTGSLASPARNCPTPPRIAFSREGTPYPYFEHTMKSHPSITVALILATASCLAAQSAPPIPRQTPAETVTMEAFTVTGTNIKRLDQEKSLPVTIISSDDIEARDAATPMNLLESIAFITDFPENETPTNAIAGRGDNANIALRGLGARVFCFDLIFSGEGKGRRRDGSGGAP